MTLASLTPPLLWSYDVSMSPLAVIEQYQQKLKKVEKDLLSIKKSGFFGVGKKNISLKGFLKGVEITPADIDQAKKSLFKSI